MTAREFYDTVVKMRQFQRAYFRSKGQDTEALRFARNYEQIIDREIKRVELIEKEKQQPRIDFGDY